MGALFSNGVLWLLFLALVLYVTVRAVLLSFTHDEALSYTVITGNDFWTTTANHHILNTNLMRFCSWIFGHKEFSLRLPNVMAFVLFGYFGIKIIKEHSKGFLTGLFGFILLVLNPFLLDFFSIARGYGISLGLVMVSLYYFLRKNNSTQNYVYSMLLAYAGSALATVANLNMVNLHLSLLAIIALELLHGFKNGNYRLTKNSFIAILAFVAVETFFMLYIIKRLLVLKAYGQLYYGGSSGFIRDTVGSQVFSWQYGGNYSEQFSNWVIYLAIALCLAALVYALLRVKKGYSALHKIAAVLALNITAVLIQHYILGSLFPVDRTALVFLPLFALLLVFFLEDVIQTCRINFITLISYAFSMAVIGLFIYNFWRAANLKYTLTWRYDAGTKQMMKVVAEKIPANSQDTIVIASDWLFEPAINYYRVAYGYNLVAPANRDGLSRPADFYYSLKESMQQVPAGRYNILYKDEVSGAALLSRRQ